MTQQKRADAQLERAMRRAGQATARLETLRARERAREKNHEATRHYRLGLVLESFLFEDAALLKRVRELIESEAPRVRAAFALDEETPWFEQPARADSKSLVDTRRFRLGMLVERLLPTDAALRARAESLMREQAPHVRAAFGLDGEGSSWFDKGDV